VGEFKPEHDICNQTITVLYLELKTNAVPSEEMPMCRTARCRLFLIVSILVVSSAPAAVAAESLCAAPTYLPPVGTRAVLDGFGTQAAIPRPPDVDPARSKLRPTSCTYDNIEFYTAYYEEYGTTCGDAGAKVNADTAAEAQNACCNLGGSVWYLAQDGPWPCGGCNGAACVRGRKVYKCTICDPAIC
jgi:hypothetical protein